MSAPFLFLSANTPWVYALAEALSQGRPVSAVRFYDWLNYRRLRPVWPNDTQLLRRATYTFPPGYAGTLEPAFRALVQMAINSERTRLRRLAWGEPFVVCPYPYLAPWIIETAPADRLIYYNLDDYTLYDPARAARIRHQEARLVQHARLTLCLSAHQTRTLKERFPDHAARIVHFPLGVVEDFINPAPRRDPGERVVGYVGNLTNRVDWALVCDVARQLPDVRFDFVGSLERLETGLVGDAWETRRKEALALPNVAHVGSIPQAEVARHYWGNAVNWMPYEVSHPFNIASCPTKIMDALASGRPFVSTSIPEARLYGDRIRIGRDAEEMAGLLASALTDGAHDPVDQTEFARTQTWPRRARELLGCLSLAQSRPAAMQATATY